MPSQFWVDEHIRMCVVGVAFISNLSHNVMRVHLGWTCQNSIGNRSIPYLSACFLHPHPSLCNLHCSSGLGLWYGCSYSTPSFRHGISRNTSGSACCWIWRQHQVRIFDGDRTFKFCCAYLCSQGHCQTVQFSNFPVVQPCLPIVSTGAELLSFKFWGTCQKSISIYSICWNIWVDLL